MTTLSTTTLLWVRHGEADSNRDGRFGGHSPVPLTPKGQAQAAATAIAIAKLEPTAIVASDLMRARQTAEPIAKATGLAPTWEPGLRERSLGILDGLGFAEAETKHPELYARLRKRDPDLVPDGGESNDQVHARVCAAIDRVIANHPGGKVVVVSHGIALYHAFAHVCGLGKPGPEHTVFMLLDNCSVSTLEHRHDDAGRSRWRIVRLNDVAHLADVQ